MDKNYKFPTDSEMIDWIESMMESNNKYCEIFFSGLRDFTKNKALLFQIESNPQLFPTISATSVRCVIAKAMKDIENNDTKLVLVDYIELSKQESIRFGRWLLKNSLDTHDEKGLLLHLYEGVMYTTENLYAEYKKLGN